MSDYLTKLNSKHLPAQFPREFDAHVYFDSVSLPQASLLREQALSYFKDAKVFVGYMIERPVGPHPMPMFEINFPKEVFSEVVLWLLHHHGNLSILVHELTGDDFLDHTEFSMWIGQSVELDLSAFTKKN